MRVIKLISALSLLLATGNLRAGLGSQFFYNGPTAVPNGTQFSLVFSVKNTGTTTTAGVLASFGYVVTSGSVSVTAVSPAFQDLAPGAAGNFVFVFIATGCGKIMFSASAAGSDLVAGPVGSQDAFWPLEVTCLTPTAVSADQGTANIPNNMFKPYKDGPLQFRFNVPEDGTVSIKIYDRNGKLVMSRQVDAAAGAHVEFWDGRTSAGDVAATGIYAVQFQGKGLRKTLKIAIVK